eukprot:12537666-Prorocentrum_lima.AAC.1
MAAAGLWTPLRREAGQADAPSSPPPVSPLGQAAVEAPGVAGNGGRSPPSVSPSSVLGLAGAGGSPSSGT